MKEIVGENGGVGVRGGVFRFFFDLMCELLFLFEVILFFPKLPERQNSP